MGEKQATSILLVEDDSIVRQALRDLLQGYPDLVVVAEASDGSEAILYVETHHPVVVVMDSMLPIMDGVTATRLIKKMYPQIAVVGLLANANDYHADAMHQAGASELLTRDNAATNLYGTIQKVIGATRRPA